LALDHERVSDPAFVWPLKLPAALPSSPPKALQLLAKISILSNKEMPMLKPTPEPHPVPAQPSLRRRTVIDTARQLGLLEGENSRIGGRIRRDLVAAAKAKSGIASDTELLEYALAKVALEDDFGAKLVQRKGHVANDVDLEF
jgi:hypothetical protein